MSCTTILVGKKASYDAYERKKDAYDAYQHSNAYPALWNAQQIILDNPNHQDLFTLLPNSKEDIKKRLESYLEDPSISDTERAAIEMLIAENEFTQLPSLEEPEVPGPAPEEPGPEPEKPGAEPEKPGTEPEKPGASLSPDAVNQMIQVLQAQNIAMQHLTLTEFTGIFNSDDKYKNLLNKIISISAIPEQDRTEEQKQLLKALKTLSTPRDDRFLTMFNPDDTSAPLDVRLAGACLRNGITLDPTDPSKSITDLSTKLTKIQGRTVSQEKNTARPNPLTPTALIDRTNKAKTEYGKIGDEIIPGKKEPYSALIDRIQQVGFSPVVCKQSFVYAHTVFKEQGRFKSFLNKVTYGKVFPKQVDRVEITEEPIAAIMADPLSAFKKALADARIKGRALGCFTFKNFVSCLLNTAIVQIKFNQLLII